MDPIEIALQRDDYDPGLSDYTPSSLIRPPQMTMLAQSYEPQEWSIYKGFMALVGTWTHTMLESVAGAQPNVSMKMIEEALVATNTVCDPLQASLAAEKIYKHLALQLKQKGIPGSMIEERLYHCFEGVGLGEKKDILVGGQLDFYLSPSLEDYKITTTSNFGVRTEAKDEHRIQAYINSYLLRKNGYACDVCCIRYIFRDWSYGRAAVAKDYPRTPTKDFVFDAPPMQEVEDMLLELIHEHEKAKHLGECRPCTREERWQNDDKWAVIGVKAQKAWRVKDSLEEAQELIKEKGSKYKIEHRPGECRRCESWCEYSHVCEQFSKEKNGN